MSLLNQVLHDLDERSAPALSVPLRLAVNTPGGSGPDMVATRPARSWAPWVLLIVVGGVIVVAMLWRQSIPEPDNSVVRSAVLAIPAPQSTRSARVPMTFDPADSGDPVIALAGSPGVDADAVDSASAKPASPAPDAAAANPGGAAEYASEGVNGNDSSDSNLGNLSADRADASSPDRRFAAGVNDYTRPVASPDHTSRNPDLMERAQQALSRGDLAEAEALLQARLSEYPSDANARELLIGLMLRGERHAAALLQLERGIQSAPDSAKLKLIKAQLLVQMGQLDAARQQLLELLQAGAAPERVLMMLGAVHQQLQRPERAEENYRALLELVPSSGAAWVGLAIALDSQGSSNALGIYRRAVKIGGLPAAAESYARQRIDGLGQAQ